LGFQPLVFSAIARPLPLVCKDLGRSQAFSGAPQGRGDCAYVRCPSRSPQAPFPTRSQAPPPTFGRGQGHPPPRCPPSLVLERTSPSCLSLPGFTVHSSRRFPPFWVSLSQVMVTSKQHKLLAGVGDPYEVFSCV